MSVSSPPPKRPQNVRVLHSDGRVTPVELSWRGLDPETGLQVWAGVTTLGLDDQLLVGVMPPRTRIVMGSC